MISQLYALLCAPGVPFGTTTKEDLISLVRYLGTKESLVQDWPGLLLHGPLGEKFVDHYTFYAAFAVDEEFRLVSGRRTLGTLPVSQVLSIGQRIMFAGKTWIIEIIDEPQNVIFVRHVSGSIPHESQKGAKNLEREKWD